MKGNFNVENMTNDEIAELVKSDPQYMLTLQMVEEMKVMRATQRSLEANFDIFITKTDKKIDSAVNAIADVADMSKKTEVRVTDMADKFDTMAHDNTGVFELYKATARNRVWNLVGNKAGSLKHVLFYAPFMSKIYSDIYNHFGANNSGAIRMEDSDLAIDMAKKWRPSRKYVSNKIAQYVREESKGILSESRAKALNRFMEVTNGTGRIQF